MLENGPELLLGICARIGTADIDYKQVRTGLLNMAQTGTFGFELEFGLANMGLNWDCWTWANIRTTKMTRILIINY